MAVVEAIVAGAVGGFLATFLSNITWRWFRRPSLEIETEVDRLSEMKKTQKDPGKIERVSTIFRVSVTNTGRTAAKNCRPRLHLKSSELPSPAEKDWEPPDIDLDELPDHYNDDEDLKPTLEGVEFEIDTPLCWSESGNPARITINPEETASFDLVKVDELGLGDDPTFYFVKFPSEQGWNESAKPVRRMDKLDLPAESTQITRSQLFNGHWDKKCIELTAENAKISISELEFYEEHGEAKISVNSKN